MAFTIPALPFEKNALEPAMSSTTLTYHHDKHHQAYCDTLNKLIAGTEYEKMPLEEIIRTSQSGPIFNNAAQTWNHSFFWNCLKPNGGGDPSGKLLDAINAKYGSMDAFRAEFTKMAVGNFGSGWTWLVRNPDGSVDIVNTSNANNPLSSLATPLMTCDVWEHAYYLDYFNVRMQFVKTFLEKLVNWDFVQQNFDEAR